MDIICTTGGQFTTEYSQELKDKMRDIKNAQKLRKMGIWVMYRNLVICFGRELENMVKVSRLSSGGFKTEEEAVRSSERIY
jgi:hypothetical protein